MEGGNLWYNSRQDQREQSFLGEWGAVRRKLEAIIRAEAADTEKERKAVLSPH